MEEIYEIRKPKFLVKDKVRQIKTFINLKSVVLLKLGDCEVPKDKRAKLKFWKTVKRRTGKYLELDENFKTSWENQFYSLLSRLDESTLPPFQTLRYVDITLPKYRNNGNRMKRELNITEIERHLRSFKEKERKKKRSRKKYPNLVCEEALIVHIKVFQPNLPYQKLLSNPRKPKLGQTLILNGYNTLAHLKDTILCEFDYCCSFKSPHKMQKEVFPSGLFYINNTFYVDTRRKPHSKPVDYSIPIKAWGKTVGINLGNTVPMHSTCIKDLRVMLKYPYLYQHLGDCEHLVTFDAIRLLNRKDSHSFLDYPKLYTFGVGVQKMCSSCGKHSIECIVTGSRRVVRDFHNICMLCYKRFYFVDGNPVESMIKCYPYVDRATCSNIYFT